MGIRDRVKQKVEETTAVAPAPIAVVETAPLDEWAPDPDATDPAMDDARVPLGPTGAPLSAFDQPVLYGLRLPPLPERGPGGAYVLPPPLRAQWLQTVEALALRGVYRAETIRELTGLPLTICRRFLRAVGRQWEARGAVPAGEIRGLLLGQAQEVGRVAFSLANDSANAVKERLQALQTVLAAGKQQAALVGAEAPQNVRHEHGGAVGVAVGVVHRVELPPDILAAIGRAAAVEKVGVKVLDVKPDAGAPLPPSKVRPGAPHPAPSKG